MFTAAPLGHMEDMDIYIFIILTGVSTPCILLFLLLFLSSLQQKPSTDAPKYHTSTFNFMQTFFLNHELQ